jgi:hypothetical protein
VPQHATPWCRMTELQASVNHSDCRRRTSLPATGAVHPGRCVEYTGKHQPKPIPFFTPRTPMSAEEHRPAPVFQRRETLQLLAGTGGAFPLEFSPSRRRTVELFSFARR